MDRKLRPRKGTTGQNNAYTGALAEVTVDTTKKTLVIHNGTTAGGSPLPTSADLTAVMAMHTGALDPHPVYLTAAEGDLAYDPIGEATAVVAAHAAAADPHTVYLLETDAVALYTSLPGAWQTPTLLNSWANAAGYRETQYRSQEDAVTLIVNLDSGNHATLFTLPVGYRPTDSFGAAVAVHDGSAVPAFGHIRVDPNGDVVLEHPNPISGHSVFTVFTFYTS